MIGETNLRHTAWQGSDKLPIHFKIKSMQNRSRSPLQFLTIAVTLLTLTLTMSTQAQTSSAMAKEMAPTGTLRASINLGNPILANKDANGQPIGVSIDLATELAKRLNVPMSLVVFDAAGKSVDAVTQEKADFGFLPLTQFVVKALHLLALMC